MPAESAVNGVDEKHGWALQMRGWRRTGCGSSGDRCGDYLNF
jgi:hypothetical protein